MIRTQHDLIDIKAKAMTEPDEIPEEELQELKTWAGTLAHAEYHVPKLLRLITAYRAKREEVKTFQRLEVEQFKFDAGLTE